MISDFFDINFPREATKQVVKEELYDKLVNEGILPRQSDVSEAVEQFYAAVGKELDDVGLPDTNVVAFQDPRIAVRLRKLDLETKKQECEDQIIKLRTIEADADRDITLDLEV